MMPVTWCGETQHDLQQALYMRSAKQVFASGDQRHALLMVVHHHCEVIADADITSPQHDIAEYPGLQRDHSGLPGRAVTSFQKAIQRCGESFQAGCNIQTDGMRLAGCKPYGSLAFIESPADARLQRTLGSLRRGLHA